MAGMPGTKRKTKPNMTRLQPLLLLSRALFLSASAALLISCVIDRTGRSRSLSLQEDLAKTHAQVQALQRQVDDQLTKTTAKLDEVEENAQLSRRNLADSGALLDTMLAELQNLRGTFEAVGLKAAKNDEVNRKYYSDIDFRLRELERRVTRLEGALRADGTLESSSEGLASPSSPGDASGALEASGKVMSDVDMMDRARNYFEKGRYKVAAATLKSLLKAHPESALKEEAEFLLAESLFKDGDPGAAIQAYQRLIDDFPSGERVPLAMLRQGEAFLSLDNPGDARLFLEELIRTYPDSKEAEAAANHLKAMER